MDKIRFIGAASVDFPMVGAEASGPFVLKGSEGLGPPDNTVRMSRTTQEKALYQGKSSALRQIIVTVGLQPEWDAGQTPEQLRTVLYGLLTPRYGQMVKFQIMHGNVVQAFAQGAIAKMEVAIFSKDPAVQITMDCDYPYFLAPTEKVQTPPQSTVGSQRAITVANQGTALAGFRMGVILRSTVGNTLTLAEDSPLGQKIQIDGVFWESGDRLLVDTRPGSRGVWRGPQQGALVSVLNNMNAKVSEWIQLYGGENKLLLNTNAAFDWDPAYNFRHQEAYWGV